MNYLFKFILPIIFILLIGIDFLFNIFNGEIVYYRVWRIFPFFLKRTIIENLFIVFILNILILFSTGHSIDRYLAKFNKKVL